MQTDPLQRLLEVARSLPGEKAALPLRPPPFPDSVPPDADVQPGEMAAMRRRLGGLLRDLAAAVEPALLQAMQHAANSWDQVDAISVLDGALRQRVARERQGWQALSAHPEPGVGAAAAEALLTIDSAVGLVLLLERRLATLVRLRLRSAEPALLDNNRPFLDVAAALDAAGRAWA